MISEFYKVPASNPFGKATMEPETTLFFLFGWSQQKKYIEK